MKNTMLHDDFIDQARHQIKNIAKLEREGKAEEAAKAGLEFAKFKVAYYEQFITGKDTITNYEKIYDDDYRWALINLAGARDRCMDLGIFEE